VLGGAAVWGLSNSLFNVEGGHRAIVFNRLMGIKEQVRSSQTVFVPSLSCVRHPIVYAE